MTDAQRELEKKLAAAGEIIQREMEAGESAATALEEADIDVRFYPLTDLIKKGL